MPTPTRGINARLWVYKAPSGEDLYVSREELEELATSGALAPTTLVAWEGLPGSMFQLAHRSAEFFYVVKGITYHALDLSELRLAASSGRLSDTTIVWGPRLPPDGVTFYALSRAELRFDPDIASFIVTRGNSHHTTICGRNNSGKSVFLKRLRREMGASTCLLSSNRFYHLEDIGFASDRIAHYEQRYDQFVQQTYASGSNQEHSDVQLQQLIGWMTDKQRDRLWDICSELLGERFTLVKRQPGNQLSPHYIDVSGKPLSLASSGTRLLLGIVAACVDDGTDTLLIDEPEIGLSPSLQRRLARYLFDPTLRKEHYPHLRTVVVATHSHLFLDHVVIENNYIVEKKESGIRLRPVTSYPDFHDVQFALLGNELESLFMPSAIVVLEGKTDCAYVRRLLHFQVPIKQVAVVNAEGEGGIPGKLRTLADAFGGLSRSPYRDRIFVLLDSQHSLKKTSLVQRGIPAERIQVLSKNGIEYYFPPEILGNIFGCNVDNVMEHLSIGDNAVSCNGLELTKTALADMVVDRIDEGTMIPLELREKLFDPLAALLGSHVD
jgi:predicted ATPase